MPGAAFTVTHVSVAFQGRPVLQDVSLEAAPGEFLAVVGASGIGKTTLLRLLAQMVAPSEGSVQFSHDAAVGAVAPQTAIVFQEPRLLPWLRVWQNVALVAPGKTADERRRQAVAALETVGLPPESFSAWPRQLSGGMAQRVALARALVTAPSLLLLDEPFSAVDALTRLRLQDYVLDLWQRYAFTVVLVTHDVDEAVYLADRVVLLAGRPAGVHAVFPIPLPRPRSRSDPALALLRGQVLSALDQSLVQHDALDHALSPTEEEVPSKAGSAAP